MKLFDSLTVLALAGALAACATKPGDGPATSRMQDAVPAADPASAAPAVAAPTATPDEAKAKAQQQKREAQQLKQDLDEESRRLASYQKNLFQVFKLTETAAGFRARPNAIGVFESKSSKTGKLRVSLAQLPESPARLNLGSYTINLDVLVEYVEMRECIAGGCLGKTQKIVRSVTKPVQISISPKSAYAGTREVSYLDARNAEPNAKNYRVSYSDLVMTVRRMTITPTPARAD
jgi:hypothetical protein